MMNLRRCAVGGVLLLTVVLAASNAIAVTVTDVQMTPLIAVDFYTGGVSPQFVVDDVDFILGNITINDQPSAAYSLVGTVDVTPVDLDHDDSAGGFARGYFDGGATMTVTGTITEIANPANTFVGTVLIAEMQISASQQWLLEEVTYPNSKDVKGSVDFTPTGGCLDTGAFDGLVLPDDFRADFSFLCSTDPVEFAGTSFTALTTNSRVQLVAIPEPVAIALLGLGAIGFVRKRMQR